MTAADTLHTAANLIRERAEAALDSADGDAWYSVTEVHCALTGSVPSTNTADATHIATFASPAVALAVADWLNSEADAFDAYMAKQADPESTFAAVWLISARVRHEQALAVARAYLNESA